MERLLREELRKLSEFLLDLYQLRSHDQLTSHLICSLPKVTEGEFTSYNEYSVDTPNLTYKSDQLPYCPDPLQYANVLQQNLHEHRVVTHFFHSKDESAHIFSDFSSRREFRTTALYNDFYKPLKMSYLLFMGFRVNNRVASISRHRNDREFPDSAKAVFNAIQPHIKHALANALAVTRMQNELDALNKATDNGQQGVIQVMGKGRIRFSNGHAQRLLKDYGLQTRSDSDLLPGQLMDWLRHLQKMAARFDDVPSAIRPLVIKGESGRLIIRRIPQESYDLIILEEQRLPPSFDRLR